MSTQSRIPSPSKSPASATPHPQIPGSCFVGSKGHLSSLSITPSPSLSTGESSSFTGISSSLSGRSSSLPGRSLSLSLSGLSSGSSSSSPPQPSSSFSLSFEGLSRSSSISGRLFSSSVCSASESSDTSSESSFCGLLLSSSKVPELTSFVVSKQPRKKNERKIAKITVFFISKPQ